MDTDMVNKDEDVKKVAGTPMPISKVKKQLLKFASQVQIKLCKNIISKTISTMSLWVNIQQYLKKYRERS